MPETSSFETLASDDEAQIKKVETKVAKQDTSDKVTVNDTTDVEQTEDITKSEDTIDVKDVK